MGDFAEKTEMRKCIQEYGKEDQFSRKLQKTRVWGTAETRKETLRSQREVGSGVSILVQAVLLTGLYG